MKSRLFLLGVPCMALCCAPVFAAEPGATPTNDQQFIQMAAQADMLEAHLGQMAEKDASRKGVRDFGAMVNLDDTTNYQTLCSIANSLGLPVPKAIDGQGDKVITELQKTRGPEFTRHFLRDELKTDKDVVSAYQQESQSGQNTALKSFAAKQLQTVKLHYYELKDLAKPGNRT